MTVFKISLEFTTIMLSIGHIFMGFNPPTSLISTPTTWKLIDLYLNCVNFNVCFVFGGCLMFLVWTFPSFFGGEGGKV